MKKIIREIFLLIATLFLGILVMMPFANENNDDASIIGFILMMLVFLLGSRLSQSQNIKGFKAKIKNDFNAIYSSFLGLLILMSILAVIALVILTFLGAVSWISSLPATTVIIILLILILLK